MQKKIWKRFRSHLWLTFWPAPRRASHLIFGVCWVLKDDLRSVLCNILKRYHRRCFLRRWLILVREPQCSWTEFCWHCGVVAWLSRLTAAAGRSLAPMLQLTHSLQSKGGSSPDGPLIYNLAHPHLLFETMDESPPQGQIWCLFVGKRSRRGKKGEKQWHSHCAILWEQTTWDGHSLWIDAGLYSLANEKRLL